MVLGDLPDREELCRPGVHQQSLECTDCFDIITTGGSVNARLKLEHLPLDGLPGKRVPSIHRCWSIRVHSMYTSTCTFTVHVVGSLSAYLVAFPRALYSQRRAVRLFKGLLVKSVTNPTRHRRLGYAQTG